MTSYNFEPTEQIKRLTQLIIDYWNECLVLGIPSNRIPFYEDPLLIETHLKGEKPETDEDWENLFSFIDWLETAHVIKNIEADGREPFAILKEPKEICCPSHFTVQVIGIKPLLEIQKTFRMNETGKKALTDFKRKVLISGMKKHIFQKSKLNKVGAFEIFNELWPRHRHTIKNKMELYKKGQTILFTNFLMNLKLIQTPLELTRGRKKETLKVKIETVIKNLRREGFPIQLECEGGTILLIVND